MPFVEVAGLWFCRYETRFRDYEAFVIQKGHTVSKKYNFPGFDSQDKNYPVVNVSWDEAQAFCEWLTASEQKLNFLTARQRYTLPTDVEMEYRGRPQ